MLYLNIFSQLVGFRFFPMKIESKAKSPHIIMIPCQLSCISVKFSTVNHQLKNFSFTFKKTPKENK